MSGRGATGPGRSSAIPLGPYVAPPAVAAAPEGLSVAFCGEDGREARFDFGRLPLPGWHTSLAAAFAARVGPAGTARTLASARSAWDVLQRFIRYLDRLPNPPGRPEDLLPQHVQDYEAARRDGGVAAAGLTIELRSLAGTLREPGLGSSLRPDTLTVLTRRRRNEQRMSRPGYSDRELTLLVRAARDDVTRIRDRIAAGEAALAGGTTAGHDERWERLTAIAATGQVPRPETAPSRGMAIRLGWAAELFLTWSDLASLLALFVVVSGRNVESIKELPAEHRVVEGRAVEVVLTKRRRGQRHWTETVTWEIGPPHRQLRTPGGLYLLIHRLCARGRSHSGSTQLWSIWRNPAPGPTATQDQHINPFAAGLHKHSHLLGSWRAGVDLTTDDPARPVDQGRLRLDFNRLKTSIDVRRTRHLGGHLPSAARSNTQNVLFSNYLRDDPTTIDWARTVMSDALVDAEQAALHAHRAALLTTTGRPHLRVTSADADPGQQPAVEAAWTGCADPDRHPVTGRTCRATFLDCFHCGNCVVTPAHLPRLLGLLDTLADRRRHLSDTDWWTRYGGAWTAIRHDILAKFTPAEVEAAAATKTIDSRLDLVENPWEKT